MYSKETCWGSNLTLELMAVEKHMIYLKEVVQGALIYPSVQ